MGFLLMPILQRAARWHRRHGHTATMVILDFTYGIAAYLRWGSDPGTRQSVA